MFRFYRDLYSRICGVVCCDPHISSRCFHLWGGGDGGSGGVFIAKISPHEGELITPTLSPRVPTGNQDTIPSKCILQN